MTISSKIRSCEYSLPRLVFIAFLAFYSASLFAQTPQSIPPHPVFLKIVTDERLVKYIVEIADEPSERQFGLMFRTDLHADAGMLFDFNQERQISMWMENTPSSLDMLFIAGDGKIVHIATDTTPFSRAIISSKFPIKYVLELNAGQVASNQIDIGDMVSHPQIGR